MQKCNSCGTINSDMYCKVCKKELDQNNSHELSRIDTIGDIFRNIKRLFLMFYHKFKIGEIIEKIKVLFALFSEVKEVKFEIPGSYSSIGEKKDIIIPFKKSKLILPFLGTIIFIVLFIILLFTEINPSFIKIVFVIGIIFFGYIGIYAFNRLFDKKPVLIINEEGIILNDLSTGILIKWKNITNIKRMWIVDLVVEVNNADEIVSCQHGLIKFFMILNKYYYGSPIIIKLNMLDCNSQELYNIIKLKSDDFIRKNNEAIVEVENNVYKKSEKPSFCSQCGSKIESDNAKFCNNCGNKINAQVVNNTIYEKMNSVELQKRIIYIAYGILMLILILVTFIIPIGDVTIMEKLKIINKDLINEILGILFFSWIGFMLIHVIFDNNTKNKKLSYLLLFLGINFLLYSIRLLINIAPTLVDILKPYFLEGHITLLLLIYMLCSFILILIPLNSYTLTNKIRFLLMIYMLFFIFY